MFMQFSFFVALALCAVCYFCASFIQSHVVVMLIGHTNTHILTGLRERETNKHKTQIPQQKKKKRTQKSYEMRGFCSVAVEWMQFRQRKKKRKICWPNHFHYVQTNWHCMSEIRTNSILPLSMEMHHPNRTVSICGLLSNNIAKNGTFVLKSSLKYGFFTRLYLDFQRNLFCHQFFVASVMNPFHSIFDVVI